VCSNYFNLQDYTVTPYVQPTQITESTTNIYSGKALLTSELDLDSRNFVSLTISSYILYF